MNGGIDPFFYGFVCAAALWLGLLWAGARCGLAQGSRRAKVGYAVLTGALLLMPLGGLPLWNWAFSFVPNPSLPAVGMICGALWPRLFGRSVFTRRDWRGIVGFGAAAGTVLYLHPVVLPEFDLYYWGWHEGIAVWSMAALALGAFASGHRGGVLLLAALIAFEVHALESHNAWDYLVDPLYWLFSVTAATVGVVRWSFGKWLVRRARNGAHAAEPVVPDRRTEEIANARRV